MFALDRSRDAVFVERLHAKTIARGVAWTPTEHEGRFSVSVGEFTVEIGEGGADDPEVLICKPDGKALELITADALPDPAAGAMPRRQMFAETYEAARRTAMGVDHAIETLINALI